MFNIKCTVTAIAAASLVSLSACSSGSSDSGEAANADETWEVCISNGSFTPMYENRADGKLEGFDPDMARAAAKEMDVDLEFTKLAFEGLMPGIASGRCKAVWSSFYISDERLAVADAVPYLNTGPGVIVPANNTDIKEPDDLSGKTVAVQSGSSFIGQLEEINKSFADRGMDKVKVSEYKGFTEEVAAMTNGRADLLLDSSVVLPNIVEKNAGFKIVPDFFPQDVQYGVYLAKGSPYIAKLSEALTTMHEEGTSAAIVKKYDLNEEDLVSPEAQ